MHSQCLLSQNLKCKSLPLFSGLTGQVTHLALYFFLCIVSLVKIFVSEECFLGLAAERTTRAQLASLLELKQLSELAVKAETVEEKVISEDPHKVFDHISLFIPSKMQAIYEYALH